MEVSGQTVRIGIDAPKSVAIYREEIWAAVRQENEAAANADPQLPPVPPRPAGPGR